MSPNLENRIRLLTDQAIAATTETELDGILMELEAAIKDHMRYVRAVSIAAKSHSTGTAQQNGTLSTKSEVSITTGGKTGPKSI